ncbi:MAG: cbb3-type cytochrome c oxidase subunit I [Candidatus Rokubacteria bacterium]|nr:cbb3-type cytochrome c oxidase subunit I [Candidatus Rokubacteria bacterium]
MPPLVRRYIKTAFVFMLLGMLAGAFMSVSQGFLGRPIPPLLVVAHGHALLVGFVLMTIIGVATWMFPRPAREDLRYRPELAEAIYWIMTLGTALRFVAEVAGAYRPGPELRVPITVGGLGQALAAVLFVYNMWARVRAPSTLREP